jgi:hypothetical protein
LFTMPIGAAAVLACALAAAVDAPDAVLLGLGGVASAAMGSARPARLSLMRWLTATTSELSSTNVVMGATEALSFFVGPTVGAVAVAWGSRELALALPASMLLAAYVAVRRVPAVEPTGWGRGRRVRAGFTALVADGRLPAGLFVVQTFSRGLLNVLVVAAAIETLGTGESGVGLLQAMLGVGGLLGVVLVGTNTSARGIVFRMAGAFVLWGAPLAFIGLFPHVGVAVAALAVTGIANVAVDVNGFTVLQRALPGATASDAFAAFESILLGGVGTGALVAGILHDLVGVRTALVVAGSVLPAAVALAGPALRRLSRQLDDAERRLEAMRSVPSLATMPVAALDVISRRAVDAHFQSGEHLLTAGGRDTDVFVVLEGRAAVLRRGRRRVGTIEPGQIVGEVAALYDVARTASVVAESDLVALRLRGDDFVRAMHYSDDAHVLVRQVIAGYGRLARVRSTA